MSDSLFWTATSLAICSFLAGLLLILPLTLKIRARNIPLITILVSVLLNILLRAINALIWPTPHQKPFHRGEGLCDVEVQLFTALDVAIPGGLLCLFRHLSRLLKTSRLGVKPSKTQKRRTAIFETFFCIALPILSMPAAYVVQPGRYAIFPVQGCVPLIDLTLPTYFLVTGWPVAIHMLSLVYASTATVRMIKHYNELSRMFADIPNASRFKADIIKTYIYACILYSVRTPLIVYGFLFRNQFSVLEPFSWSRIHPINWSDIIIIYGLTSSWQVVFGFSSILFALLSVWCFGSGQDAKDELRSWRAWLRHIWTK